MLYRFDPASRAWLFFSREKFVTITTKRKKHYSGVIKNGKNGPSYYNHIINPILIDVIMRDMPTVLFLKNYVASSSVSSASI